MKLETVYKYKTASGLVKTVIRFENATHRENLSLDWGAGEVPLLFNQDWISRNDQVEIGLNTYHLIEGPEGFVKIKLMQNGEVLSFFELNIRNDANLFSLISAEMKRLPAIIGFPIRSALFDKLALRNAPISKNEFFEENGYLILKSFFEPNLMDRCAAQLDHHCALGHGGYAEGSSTRLKNLHLFGGAISELFADSSLRRELKDLFNYEMQPCQTLSYKYGSQQSAHSDFIHLTAYPENLMCGVWVALEDVVEGSGELSFYPGSHRTPKLFMDSFGLGKIRNDDYATFSNTFDVTWKKISDIFPRKTALLKKGDVLVWASNLLHGGSPRKIQELTRRSVVLHYFAMGSAVYYDATGDLGYSGELPF